MSDLEVKYLSVNDLVPYANNPRTHSEKQVTQVASSIKEFGFNNPILIDEGKGIIAGHGRLAAAKKLGLEAVPTITLEGLTEAQRKAYVIADNKLTENSEWDYDLLTVEVERLKELDFDLDLTGFDEDELNALLEPTVVEGLTDEDEVPEPPDNPITKLGDIWILGNHRLMCGDATSIEDIDRLTQGQKVDMWLTDPPYNVSYEGGTKDKLTIKNDNLKDEDFRQFLRDSYSAADTAMKPGAVFYIWHADVEGYNFRGAAKDVGWKIRQCLIWKKSSLVMGRQDFQWIHEPCLYGWKDGASHLWANDRKQTTVIEVKKPRKNGEHPTMKPVELFEYQLLNNTRGMDLILDTFGGSGTTMIAAEKNQRQSRVMELDPKYCDVIVDRWQSFTGKTAQLDRPLEVMNG